MLVSIVQIVYIRIPVFCCILPWPSDFTPLLLPLFFIFSVCFFLLVLSFLPRLHAHPISLHLELLIYPIIR